MSAIPKNHAHFGDGPLDRLVVGALLVSLRRLRGISQGDLAARIGFSQSSLSRIERGSTSVGLLAARRLLKGLSVAPGELDELHSRTFEVVGALLAALEDRGLPVPDECRCDAIAVVAAEAVVTRWFLEQAKGRAP